jgi:tetratricopeptide (TPR) repeat protein
MRKMQTHSLRCPVFLWPALLLALLLASPAAHAQQSSRELQELQETTRDLYQSGAYLEALQVAERALAVAAREFGPEHEQTSIHYHSLGLISEAAGDLAAADRYYTASLRIKEKVYGLESPAVAVALDSLAGVFVKTGRLDAAEPLLQRALNIRQDVVGRDHAFSASGHANLGAVYLARRDWPAALTSYRQAIRLLTSQDTSQTIVKSLVEDDIKRHRETFVGLCRAAWNLQSAPGANPAAAADETFQAAQLAWKTSAAGAIAKMTARLGAGNSELGQRVRRAQDLADRVLSLHADDQNILGEWSAVQRVDKTYSALSDKFRALSIARNRDNAPAIHRQMALAEKLRTLLQRCPTAQTTGDCAASDRERNEISKELSDLAQATAVGGNEMMDVHRRMETAEQALPGYQAFMAKRTALRSDIDRAEEDVGQARALIVKTFPDFVALSDPKPLSVAAAQGLLRRDEALLAILTGSSKSFVWALTRERAEWAEIDAGSAVLSAHVVALRRGLDPQAQQDAEGTPEARAGVVEGFDSQRAHELYTLVLGAVARTFAGKRHLILVPTGPLTSLPFQVLLTQPPSGSDPAANVFARAP